jgi:hypothetical protein
LSNDDQLGGSATPSHDDKPQPGAPTTTVVSEHSEPAETEVSELDPSEDDLSPTGGVGDKYKNRPYARTERGLQQWFHPLPEKPKVLLLTREQIQESKERIQAAAQRDRDVASDLLQEATVLFDYRDDRIKAAETKATSLMGAVAIAASLVVAGAGLILDPKKVANVWRELLMVTVLVLLFCLLMCGYLSSRALLTVLATRRPQARHALRRARKGNAIDARVDRALDLIERANDNRYVADFKVVQNEAAHRWYKLALALFVALGAVLAAYVLFGNMPT